MALYKQYQLLSDQLNSGASQSEIADKKVAKGSPKAITQTENVDPLKVVLPKYPTLPGSTEKGVSSEKIAATTTPPKKHKTLKKGGSGKKWSAQKPIGLSAAAAAMSTPNINEDEVFTLSGNQLKQLINQYAAQAIKSELKKILSKMTVDE